MIKFILIAIIYLFCAFNNTSANAEPNSAIDEDGLPQTDESLESMIARINASNMTEIAKQVATQIAGFLNNHTITPKDSAKIYEEILADKGPEISNEIDKFFLRKPKPLTQTLFE